MGKFQLRTSVVMRGEVIDKGRSSTRIASKMKKKQNEK